MTQCACRGSWWRRWKTNGNPTRQNANHCRERFGSLPNSGLWFLARAFEWFNEADGQLILHCVNTNSWDATFYEDADDEESWLIISGDTALEAVTNLLWEMRG